MILITGSTGLIGYAACQLYLNKKEQVIGIDNDFRSYFFGKKGSNKWKELILKKDGNYKHYPADIRNKKKIFEIFKKYGKKINSIIHTAAQPSHDWAAKEPFTDFEINANGTLNLLEAFRIFCPESTFIFTSTNKVYGDRPNYLPIKEKKFRFEIDKKHSYYKNGINEKMSLDQTTHSIFGSSKVSADILVQEYGRYFNLKTATFRGGCLTGENHSGAQLHGFLSYLIKSILNKRPYYIFGYKGKQVRDNIHSDDVVLAMDKFRKKPKLGGKVYNLGGGRDNSCSILEAIKLIEKISNIKSNFKILKKNRIGDHIWWITDNSKFIKDYPNWKIKYSLQTSLEQMIKFEYDQTNSNNAKVVIIGGGVIGCSVAYHLAKFGWKDTILLERDQLTSGTTWHAAGLVSQLGPSAAITKIRKYTLDLYKELEKKVDHSAGLRLNGALSIAETKGRWQELQRQATTAQLYDVDVKILDKDQIKKEYPIVNTDDVIGGILMPGDGAADPSGVTHMLAKAARQEGAKIFEKSPVEEIITKDGKISGVKVNGQKIDCEYIVLASGMWSRQIGEKVGVSIPLYPAEHFYIITEPIENLSKTLPTIRDFDNRTYIKEDAGKILVGIFEGNSIPAWDKTNKVPEDFSFGEFQENFEHFEPYLASAIKRFPVLETAGIRKFFSGPESFTPDTNTLLGEVPEVKNFFVCCGLNSIGIGTGGGVGKVTAEWLMTGHINEDIFSYDIKRFQKFHSDLGFIKKRITESLGDLYGMHWPFKQHKTSRNVKTLPHHENLKSFGACFGVSGGYERPMWFALDGEKAEYEYSYNYQSWYPSAEYETNNTIQNVGLFDLTPFSKFEIKSDKAHQELQKICTANIKNEPGKCVYTHMLNPDGGIETDLTVVCVDGNHFRMISSAATRERDKFHIKKHLSKDIELKDITDDLCVFGLFGPKSRDLMKVISKDNFDNNDFKFGRAKYITIEGVKIWAQRLSYVGELGYELYVEFEDAKKIYELIINKGKNFNLSNCGMHAMDIMRMESGFLHWGHDISPEENQYQAGLSFTISKKKDVDFIGKKAIEKIKQEKTKTRFAMFTLKESEPGKPLLLHDEPIYIDDKIIGRSTSGNYSFNFKKNLVFGYIKNDLSNDELQSKNLFIEVEKKKYPISIQLGSLKRTDYKNL